MKKPYSLSHIILPCLLVFFLAGCELFGSKDPEPGRLTVEISNQIASEDIALNEQIYTSTAGHNFSITLIEYILTDIALVDEDGNVVPVAAAHYVNGDDATTLNLDPVEVPAGRYTSLQFTYGITGEDNVFGALERTQDFDNMLWPMMMPMGDGQTERYHYMRFEGRYGTDSVFRIHNGPTGGNDYSIDVSMPIDIDVDGQDWTAHIKMELDQWLTAPNTWNFDDYGMIMGNPAAQSLLYDNGQSVFELDIARQ